MVSFIARRLVVSILILVAASFIMYVLASASGDPLSDLNGTNSPNRQSLIDARVQAQHLDVPPPLRWAIWLGGVARCVVPVMGGCNLGSTFTGQPVTALLPQATASTIQLVTTAFLLAIILGIALGIITALRVYSGFDYIVTLLSFFLFSLPSFLMAVLLKSFIALGYNNFLAHPQIPPLTLALIGIIVGVVLQLVVGGTWKRRAFTFIGGGVATVAILALMASTGWFTKPSLGPVVIILLSAGIAFGTVSLLAGLRNRRAWITAGINVALAVIAYFSLQGLFNVSSVGTLVILGIATLAIGIVSGAIVGGHDRGLMMRIGAITAVLSGGLVLLDRFLQSWFHYTEAVGGRPIATVGSQTPSLGGNVWITGLDSFAHLLLPTISLLLISFASYTRYSRSGMLDTLNQDYVRTARAKGLPERTVIVRHAFRNMLIPIATLVATDVGALLGGAIITERVFAISGMGALFSSSLGRTDVNPVMGYFLVIAVTAIAFNFIADLAYASLDPRVRVR